MPPTTNIEQVSVQLTPVFQPACLIQPPLCYQATTLKLEWIDELLTLRYVDVSIAVSDPSIYRLIRSAQRKLQESDSPHLLKIAAYLRICSSAIQRSFIVDQLTPLPNLYLDLMGWLAECDPQWWLQCKITDELGIVSDNVCIQNLLQPLEEFVGLVTKR
ncbi:MAG: hypothetical protein Kow00121_49040 [Elainellaceae cyanobacterium]